MLVLVLLLSSWTFFGTDYACSLSPIVRDMSRGIYRGFGE
jgi:hypothetical protein